MIGRHQNCYFQLAGGTRLQSGAPEEYLEVMPIAVDHHRFRVINSISRRVKSIVVLYSQQPLNDPN
jgi:hypothetical protein